MVTKEIWVKIIKETGLINHSFSDGPFYVKHKTIKDIVSDIDAPNNSKEIRILGYQATREQRPEYFIKNNLFLLPASNREWVVVEGEGYIDIPKIKENPIQIKSKLDFKMESLEIGTSEMQYLDSAFVHGITQHFLEDESIELTVRGRKRTAPFNFSVQGVEVECKGVQTEVDAGYEGRTSLTLVEAKSSNINNEIIRQLYFPFRKWSMDINKNIRNVFFQFDKDSKVLSYWEYGFQDQSKYDSIYLIKAQSYQLVE